MAYWPCWRCFNLPDGPGLRRTIPSVRTSLAEDDAETTHSSVDLKCAWFDYADVIREDLLVHTSRAHDSSTNADQQAAHFAAVRCRPRSRRSPFSWLQSASSNPRAGLDFLGRALLSARRQTYAAIETLVGDGTPDGELESLVSATADTRIRYVRHGFHDRRHSLQALWTLARGKYVKWLADDGILMPTSVEVLVHALRQHPQSALAFHGRVFIDQNESVVHTPPPLLNVGERALIDHGFLIREMVGQLNNFVGEFSNVLIDREHVAERDLWAYRATTVDFLNDVATYLNLAERAPLVAVGGCGSMSRLNAGDAEGARTPNYGAGLYEWEVFVRGEAAAGRLTGAALADVAEKLRRHYAANIGDSPEIAPLLANVGELTTRSQHELFDGERFQSDLAFARASAVARMTKGASTARPLVRSQRKVCAVCEQDVDAWLPHPHGVDRSFLEEIEPVGSTLERHLCPKCGCNDRERHLWLYIALSGLLERASEMRILHVAPEPGLEPRIRRLAPREYVAGDLFPRAVGHRKINVEALDFADGHFDLIISPTMSLSTSITPKRRWPNSIDA